MPSCPRRALATATAALALGAATLHAPAYAAPPTTQPSTQEHVTFTQWDFGSRNPGGTYDGTRRAVGREDHALELATPTATRSYTDPFASTPTAREYDEATWTSPQVSTPFGLDELVASWNARTPGGSWIETSVQGVADDGTTSKWYVLGRWADDDIAFHPTSVTGQRDDLATVSVDTLVARNGHTFDRYRVKVALLRPAGSTVTPSVDMVGATASHVPDTTAPPVAPPTTMTETRVLDVPTYSQELHTGDYEQWDGGIGYVIHPESARLPKRDALQRGEPNW